MGKIKLALCISALLNYQAYATVSLLENTQFAVVRQIAIHGTKDINALLDSNGKQSQSYHYSPNGENNVIDPTDPIAFIKPMPVNVSIDQNPFQYSGEYQDLESGLYYQRARYYSPEIERFIQRDSYDLINRYNYANGNPMMNVDPSGHKVDWTNAGEGIGLFIAGLVSSFIPGWSALSVTLLLQSGGKLGMGFSQKENTRQDFQYAYEGAMFVSSLFNIGSFRALRAVSDEYKGYRAAKWLNGSALVSNYMSLGLYGGSYLANNKQTKKYMRMSANGIAIFSNLLTLSSHAKAKFSKISGAGKGANLYQALRDEPGALAKTVVGRQQTRKDYLSGRGIIRGVSELENISSARCTLISSITETQDNSIASAMARVNTDKIIATRKPSLEEIEELKESQETAANNMRS